MKKISLTFILTLVLKVLSAQLYMSALGGYSFAPHPSTTESIIFINTELNAYKTPIPIGKGFNFGIGIGYRIKDRIALEIDFYSLITTKIKFNNDFTDIYTSGNSFSIDSEIRGVGYFTSNSFHLSPALIYKIKVDKIDTYFKAGPNLYYAISHEYTYMPGYQSDLFPEAINSLETKYLHTGGLGIGFRGSLGVEKQLNKHLILNAELMFVSSSYKFYRSELILYNIGEEDKLSTIDNKVISDKESAIPVDFGQIGLSIGIKYLLIK